MKEITKFIADDGTEFDNEYECVEYENKQLLKNYQNQILVLNDDRKQITDFYNYDGNDFYYLYFKGEGAYLAFKQKFEDAHMSMPWNNNAYSYVVELEDAINVLWYWGEDDTWHTIELDRRELAIKETKLNNMLEVIKCDWD